MSLDTVPDRLRTKNASGPKRPVSPMRPVSSGGLARLPLLAALAIGMGWYATNHVNAQPNSLNAPASAAIADPASVAMALPVLEVLTPQILAAAFILVLFSAFFSAAETAYFSLNRLSLQNMRESQGFMSMMVARQMEHPGKLLASLLMGNTIVNILLAIVLAGPSEQFFEKCLLLPTAAAFPCAIAAVTLTLVFFGEILPKVGLAGHGETVASTIALPIWLFDIVLAPVRDLALLVVRLLFTITGFSKVAHAPFITDDEFLSVLHEGEASGVIERGERQMIQGILEFSEVMLKEVLVPRPDMITLPATATIREAVTLFREQEYARMPVFKDSLDNMVGILYAKDLLAYSEQSDIDRPILPLLRKVHFVPETMTVAGFVKMAQRLRTHMAIVVDEYGGTEGLITLQDALREVVGDIGDDVEEIAPGYTKLQEGVYRIDGWLSLHELEELTGLPFEDEEHTTVAGFLMDKTDKIPEVGDKIDHAGVRFTVEKVDGKRVALLRLQVLEPTAGGAAR